MLSKFPKDDARFRWTRHIKNKMLYYGLSAQRIRRVLQSPDRLEEGIAEGTIAAMQRVKNRKHPEEIWVMYIGKNSSRTSVSSSPKSHQILDNLNSKRSYLLMVSAWRYPGITRPGDDVPIPDDLLDEIRAELARL